MRFMLKYVMMPVVFPLMGEMVHKLEVGAKRFVDAISNERYARKDRAVVFWLHALSG